MLLSSINSCPISLRHIKFHKCLQPFTCENITEDTYIKDYESIDMHGIRNTSVK
jgi:hypothetical protein